jgi:hypothetical protein
MGAVKLSALLVQLTAPVDRTKSNERPSARYAPGMSSRATRAIVAFAFVASAATPKSATADEPPARDSDVVFTPAVTTTPPPLDIPYLQYGFAFTTEFVASAGRICASGDPCILGSGGGIVARVGRRAAGPWYFGGAYELSKQDPASLYRFATLQQLRAETRWYLATGGYDTQPYMTAGVGMAGYGNEWGVDTWGPVVSVGIGFESQLSRRTVVGVALSYRMIGLRSFVDSTGAERESGITQLIGIDLSMEERDPLAQAPK